MKSDRKVYLRIIKQQMNSLHNFPVDEWETTEYNWYDRIRNQTNKEIKEVFKKAMKLVLDEKDITKLSPELLDLLIKEFKHNLEEQINNLNNFQSYLTSL